MATIIASAATFIAPTISSSNTGEAATLDLGNAFAPACAVIGVSRAVAMRSGRHLETFSKVAVVGATGKVNKQQREPEEEEEQRDKQYFDSCEKLRTIISRHVPPFFTYIELFAGVGGFGVAAEKLGGRCVFASELARLVCIGWQANFGVRNPEVAKAMRPGDIRSVRDDEFPPASMNVDLLVGGFPCQPFSKLGSQPATSCDDGLLFTSIVRILNISRPRVFLLENVPGIASAEDGDALKRIGEELSAKAGYDVVTATMNSVSILPQRRKRMYFVGFRREQQEQNLPAAAAALARFQWPTLPVLFRPFTDIKEKDDAFANTFRLTDKTWSIKLDISDGIVAPWIMDITKPGPTLHRKWRAGPGFKAGKKFLLCLSDTAAAAAASSNVVADGAGALDDEDGNDNAIDDDVGNLGNNNVEAVEVVTPQAVQTNNDDDDNQATPAAAAATAVVPTRHPRGWFKFIQTTMPETPAGTWPRYITHREAARMQGFPEHFVLLKEKDSDGPSTAYMGNAVSPPIIAAILHSALCAAKVPIFRRRLTQQQSDDLRALVCEMLLEAVPVEEIEILRERLSKAEMRQVATHGSAWVE